MKNDSLVLRSPYAGRKRLWAGLGLLVAILGFLIVALLAFKFWEGSGKDSTRIYRPDGFNDTVRAMISSGTIGYQPSSGHAQEKSFPYGRIYFDPDAASERERRFFDGSRRLRRDIIQFNTSGTGLFRVPGPGRIEIDPYAHQIPMPQIATGTQLEGYSLALGDEAVLSLANPHTILSLEMGGDRPRATREKSSLPHGKWAATTGSTTRRAPMFELLLPGRSPRAAVRVYALREHVLLEVPTQDARVYLNGTRLNFRDSAEVKKIKKRIDPDLFKPELKANPQLFMNSFLLAEGDRIRISLGKKSTFFRFGTFSGAAITRMRLVDGKAMRLVNPRFDEIFPLAGEIDTAIRAYSNTHVGRRPVGDPGNVRLSIESDLQEACQQKLESFLAGFDRSQARHHDIRTRPGAISVIDARNGRLLALASYPLKKDLDRLVRDSLSGRGTKLSESAINRLRRNQNFTLIPIGSTTKPLFATAIWECHKDLRKLVVDNQAITYSDGTSARGLKSIYGVSLHRPLKDVSGRNFLDARDFLTYSSNSYVACLYFASLSDPGTWKIGRNGRLVPEGGRLALPTHIFTGGDSFSGDALFADYPATHQKLNELFDLGMARETAPNNAHVRDNSHLRPLLERLKIPLGPEAEHGGLPPAFYPVCPDHPNLDLANISNVRGDLISCLVGSGNNKWSNAKLCEAFARIGTGRRVEMTLVVDPEREEQDGTVDFDRLDVSDAVWDIVHDGMRGAIMGGGTASSPRHGFRPALDAMNKRVAPRGLRFDCLGKTGTARRTTGRDCAAFAFFLSLQSADGRTTHGSVASTIYLEDRASSPNALALAARYLDELGNYLLKNVQEK